ncbi:MAG: response regulator [Anaerolineae bacterium]|nr:response regulator [Anaerolineae bacterium]
MTNSLALIIEDDEDLANIFSLTLSSIELEAEIIHDGETAMARLAESVPALIVLDLHLPAVNGETILQQIRADERLSNSRVIVATADARMADSVRKIADLVLLKPISPSQLQELAMRLSNT